jgi:hypothetical protein
MVVVRFPKNVVAAPRIDYRGPLFVLVLLALTALTLYRMRKA